ncbi:SurA N-terminal domain-containing protein [Streptomyces sp. RB6PN25]|uniref:SurA N-terminal domain-containing protein n=1 Tax=Streptomyces humicola TaxID=2953240 RepID=A0ABT1PS78_9ACTN|nr:SurA N-terminal domain-containing protein [Streptomyces humicola]MCQ4080519.1 SurA N-terminal domain-containing protein [Streptomyces humicola]
MVRRRTATLSLSTVSALALLAAAPMITSCGSTHAGAAAVVDGQTISDSALESQVKAVRTAQNQTSQAGQLIEATSGLDRSMLGNLVFDRVIDRAAQSAGITVSQARIQQLEAAAAQQAGGMSMLRTQLLEQYAVAPGQVDGFYRVQAEAQGIARSLGVDLSTPQGQESVTKELAKTSQQLHIDVNPRYGTWNNQTLTLGSASEPWLRQAAAPSPSALTGQTGQTAQS